MIPKKMIYHTYVFKLSLGAKMAIFICTYIYMYMYLRSTLHFRLILSHNSGVGIRILAHVPIFAQTCFKNGHYLFESVVLIISEYIHF